MVTEDRQHLGGVILAGLRTSVEALEMKTARLPNVEIVQATELVGRSTIECIQAGLYFGNLAVIRELSAEIRRQTFRGEPALLIGTGGFSQLFESAGVFDVVVTDLVLLGLRRALALNPGASRPWALDASPLGGQPSPRGAD